MMRKSAFVLRGATGLTVALLCAVACSGSDNNIDEPVDEGNGGAPPESSGGSASGGRAGTGGSGGATATDCSDYFAEENPISFVEQPGPTALQQLRVQLKEGAPALASGAKVYLQVTSCYVDIYGMHLSSTDRVEFPLVEEDGVLVADLTNAAFIEEGRLVDTIVVQAEATTGEPVVATFANKNNWTRNEQTECEAWNEGNFDTVDWCIVPTESKPPLDQPEPYPESSYECSEESVACYSFFGEGFYYESQRGVISVDLWSNVVGRLTDARLVLFHCDCSDSNTCESGTQRVEEVVGQFTEYDNDGEIWHSFTFPVPNGLESVSQAVLHFQTDCGDRAEVLYIDSTAMRCGTQSPWTQLCLSQPEGNQPI